MVAWPAVGFPPHTRFARTVLAACRLSPFVVDWPDPGEARYRRACDPWRAYLADPGLSKLHAF